MEKVKEEILDCLKNTTCRIRTSPIEGVGVFAIRDLPAGLEIFKGVRDVPEYNFSLSELDVLSPEVRGMVEGFFVVKENETVDIAVGGLYSINVSYFLNHSDHPNVFTDDGKTFFSLRPIKNGEELTVDYGTYDSKYKK